MTRCTRLSSLLDVHSGFYYGKALRGKSFFHKLGMKFKKRWIKRSFFWKKNLIPFLFFFLRINNSIALNYNRWSRWWMLFDDSIREQSLKNISMEHCFNVYLFYSIPALLLEHGYQFRERERQTNKIKRERRKKLFVNRNSSFLFVKFVRNWPK